MSRPTTRWYQHPSDKLIVLLLVAGAGLRLWEYLIRASLWGDELVVIRNVVSKNALTLATQTIGNAQVAPVGFILLLKAVIHLFGTSEYSTRLIPFLASLVALPLFAVLGRRFFPREALLVAIAAFSTCPPVIRYAAQVKPYSSDVMIYLLCLVAAERWLRRPTNRTSSWVAGTGAIVIWFSYPAVFTLSAITLLVLARYAARQLGISARQAAVVFGTWLISGAAFAAIEYYRRMPPEVSVFMRRFWAEWMLPAPVTASNILRWFISLARDLFWNFLGLPKVSIGCVLLILGIWYLYKHASATTLLIAPPLVTLVAAALRYYPFSGRVILFLVPSIILLLTAGVLALATAIGKRGAPIWMQQAVFMAGAVVLAVQPILKYPPPYRDSEIRPLLAYLESHRQNGDFMYVHQMAWAAFEFYGPRFSLSLNQATVSSLRGKLNLPLGPHPATVVNDLHMFRGDKRLWVVFAGGYPQEATAAVSYLDAIGRRLDCRSSYNAALYLYDLSDEQRLRTASDSDSYTDKTPLKAFACH